MNNEDGLPMQPQRPALHRQTLRLCGLLGNYLKPKHTMPSFPPARQLAIALRPHDCRRFWLVLDNENLRKMLIQNIFFA